MSTGEHDAGTLHQLLLIACYRTTNGQVPTVTCHRVGAGMWQVPSVVCGSDLCSAMSWNLFWDLWVSTEGSTTGWNLDAHGQRDGRCTRKKSGVEALTWE